MINKVIALVLLLGTPLFSEAQLIKKLKEKAKAAAQEIKSINQSNPENSPDPSTPDDIEASDEDDEYEDYNYEDYKRDYPDGMNIPAVAGGRYKQYPIGDENLATEKQYTFNTIIQQEITGQFIATSTAGTSQFTIKYNNNKAWSCVIMSAQPNIKFINITDLERQVNLSFSRVSAEGQSFVNAFKTEETFEDTEDEEDLMTPFGNLKDMKPTGRKRDIHGFSCFEYQSSIQMDMGMEGETLNGNTVVWVIDYKQLPQRFIDQIAVQQHIKLPDGNLFTLPLEGTTTWSSGDKTIIRTLEVTRNASDTMIPEDIEAQLRAGNE